MRRYREEELIDDLYALKYQMITNKLANKLTEEFHFDTFFENQITAWKKLSSEEKKEALKLIVNGDEDMTFSEFFHKFGKEFKTDRFTNFNIEMMDELLNKYTPDVVIDPCMGWGHRMLLTLTRGITYIGSDIRYEIYKENKNLIEFAEKHIQIERAYSLNPMDGADLFDSKYNFKNNFLMFTCPPYFDDEIYSDMGIENTSHKEYLDWWGDIASKSYKNGIGTFAYQITSDYGDDLREVTEAAGFEFVEHIENTRKLKDKKENNPIKKKYGKIYVFKHK